MTAAIEKLTDFEDLADGEALTPVQITAPADELADLEEKLAEQRAILETHDRKVADATAAHDAAEAAFGETEDEAARVAYRDARDRLAEAAAVRKTRALRVAALEAKIEAATREARDAHRRELTEKASRDALEKALEPVADAMIDLLAASAERFEDVAALAAAQNVASRELSALGGPLPDFRGDWRQIDPDIISQIIRARLNQRPKVRLDSHRAELLAHWARVAGGAR